MKLRDIERIEFEMRSEPDFDWKIAVAVALSWVAAGAMVFAAYRHIWGNHGN